MYLIQFFAKEVKQMKGKGYFLNVLCIIVIFIWCVFSLAACGGDGGDGIHADISYTGPTELVTIDANNAVDIASKAYIGGSAAGVIGESWGIVQNGESEHISQSRTLILSYALAKALCQIDVNPMSSGIASGAILQQTGTENGTCGGSLSWSLSINDQTGDFSGNFSFNNFCEEDATMSGSMGISGTFNMVTEEFAQISITFTAVNVSTLGDSFSVSGSFDINFSGSLSSFTMNLYMLEVNTGKVYWFDNYNMSMTEVLDYVDVEVTGKFYDPDYGCVILSTTIPLRIYDTDEYPSQGVLIVTGKTGIGGESTKARLTALTSATYEVEADTNGDGTYDWTSPETLNWYDL